jgi:hypothetical protein
MKRAEGHFGSKDSEAACVCESLRLSYLACLKAAESEQDEGGLVIAQREGEGDNASIENDAKPSETVEQKARAAFAKKP